MVSRVRLIFICVVFVGASFKPRTDYRLKVNLIIFDSLCSILRLVMWKYLIIESAEIKCLKVFRRACMRTAL